MLNKNEPQLLHNINMSIWNISIHSNQDQENEHAVLSATSAVPQGYRYAEFSETSSYLI